MYIKPLYIFDLDGTLANIEHRRHLVTGDNKDWAEFYKRCVDDTPNIPVIKTVKILQKSNVDIWIWSGRSDEVQTQTLQWLKEHVCYFKKLRMRAKDDYTPDEILKKKWYDEMLQGEKERLVAVFDDRQKVVDMWRENGVCCFQVAPGDF